MNNDKLQKLDNLAKKFLDRMGDNVKKGEFLATIQELVSQLNSVKGKSISFDVTIADLKKLLLKTKEELQEESEEEIDEIKLEFTEQLLQLKRQIAEEVKPRLQEVKVINPTPATIFPDVTKYFDDIKQTIGEWAEWLGGLARNTFKVEVQNPQKEVVIVDEDGKPIDFKKLKGDGNTTVYGPSTAHIATEATLLKVAGEYAIQMDDVTTTSVTYVGKAAIGSSVNSAVWQIKRVDESGTPITTVITWADGNSSYDNVWSNRSSLTYS